MEILNDSIDKAGFEPNLVSNADDVGVIQKRIIQNLYDNAIVICDVSGKNPNVMFELGVRLAFDKPTIIIKDDKTPYSFDTAPIEHLEYPRDLRFNKIQEFSFKLIEKIKKTYDKSINDPEFSTFLKHFGEFKVAKIEHKEVSQQEYILDEIKSLRNLILNTSKRNTGFYKDFKSEEDTLEVCCGLNSSVEKLEALLPTVAQLEDVNSVNIHDRGNNHLHLQLKISPNADRELLRNKVRKIARPVTLRKK